MTNNLTINTANGIFYKGMRVRLSPRGVQCHLKGASGKPSPRHDWAERTATVVRITTFGQIVVQWDDNKRPSDALPVFLLEKLE